MFNLESLVYLKVSDIEKHYKRFCDFCLNCLNFKNDDSSSDDDVDVNVKFK